MFYLAFRSCLSFAKSNRIFVWGVFLLCHIKSAIVHQIRYLHTTHTTHFLGLADNYGLWPNSDYVEDVVIGVLDAGISPELRCFSDFGLSAIPVGWKGICETSHDFPASACNWKIIGARAFYKRYEAYLERPVDESEESKSPRDTEGHGSHTASTAAGSVVQNASLFHYAQGEARGMATKARIAAYKICWKLGCFDSEILAAMDQAIADGVHVISVSVGANGYAPQYDHDSIAIGAFIKYKRVVTNVESSVDAVYNVNVVAPATIEVNVSPSKLVFSGENKTQAYEITLAKGVGYAILNLNF